MHIANAVRATSLFLLYIYRQLGIETRSPPASTAKILYSCVCSDLLILAIIPVSSYDPQSPLLVLLVYHAYAVSVDDPTGWNLSHGIALRDYRKRSFYFHFQ